MAELAKDPGTWSGNFFFLTKKSQSRRTGLCWVYDWL